MGQLRQVGQHCSSPPQLSGHVRWKVSPQGMTDCCGRLISRSQVAANAVLKWVWPDASRSALCLETLRLQRDVKLETTKQPPMSPVRQASSSDPVSSQEAGGGKT